MPWAVVAILQEILVSSTGITKSKRSKFAKKEKEKKKIKRRVDNFNLYQRKSKKKNQSKTTLESKSLEKYQAQRFRNLDIWRQMFPASCDQNRVAWPVIRARKRRIIVNHTLEIRESNAGKEIKKNVETLQQKQLSRCWERLRVLTNRWRSDLPWARVGGDTPSISIWGKRGRCYTDLQTQYQHVTQLGHSCAVNAPNIYIYVYFFF